MDMVRGGCGQMWIWIWTWTISKYTFTFTQHISNVVLQQYSLSNPGVDLLPIYKRRSEG